MNVQEVVDRVKSTFGDESSVQINDTEILRWINDSQREVVLHNETVLQSTATLNIVKDQNNYSFPSDLLVLRSIRVKIGSNQSYFRLDPYSLHEFDRFVDGWDGESNSGRPVIYTAYEREIFLFPAPDQASTAGLKLLYSKTPTEITQVSDLLTVPELYHNAVVNYCLAQANTKDNDYQASAIHQAQFVDAMRRLSERENDVARVTYPRITAVPWDML